MAHGRTISLIHRLVWLHLPQNADVAIVLEHRIDGIDDTADRRDRILRFADVGSLPRQPQHHVAAAQRVGDVDRSLGSLNSVLALPRAVGWVAAVDGPRIFPEAWRDELAKEPFAIEPLLDLADAAHGFGRPEIGRHDIVVMKLHAVEAEFLVFPDLGGEGNVAAHRRAEWIGSRADVPGTKGEPIFLGRGRHSSFLQEGPMLVSATETATRFG